MTPSLPRLGPLAAILLVAAGYYTTGRLGLMLAIPPGYATAVWPASGIALAGVLLLGNRVWPGVWLGSLLVNVGTSLDTGSLTAAAASLAVAGVIGAGASAQALAAGWLIRRFVGWPSALDCTRDIALFLGLGGPLGCLVSATCGVSVLLAAGLITPLEYSFSWLTWWSGDTIGVLIFTVLVMALAGRPRETWRNRRLAVGVPMAVAFGLAVAGFVYLSARESERIRLEFANEAAVAAQDLRQSLDAFEDVLRSIEGLHAVTGLATREQFRQFASRPLRRYPWIHALSWNPVVRAAERADFEAALRAEGLAEAITERAADGTQVRAARRAEHIVVRYIEPLAGNERVLGYDVASEASRHEAQRRARRSAQPVATAPLRLVQERDEDAGVLLFAPVYAGASAGAPADPERLVGFATGVLRLGAFVQAAVPDLAARGLLLDLSDAAAPAGERALFVAQPGVPAGPQARQLTSIHALEFAGRTWRAQFTPTHEYLAAHRSLQSVGLLTAGLLFAGLLGAFLLVLTTTARIRALVDERTRSLAHAQRELLAARNALSNSIESMSDTFALYDARDRLLLWNRRFAELHSADSRLLAAGVDFETCVRGAVRAGQYRLGEREEEVWIAAECAAHRSSARRELQLADGRWLSMSAQRMEDDSTVEIGTDITVLKERELELQRSNQELEKFAYVASHDLQEPLRKIQAFGDRLQGYLGATLDPRAADYLVRMQRAAARMSRLIDDLLLFARVSTRRQPFDRVALDELLAEVLADLETRIEQSGAVFDFGPLPQVQADARQMHQAFQNLIGNALKFQPEGQVPRIGVHCRTRDGFHHIEVSDNGIGFDPEHGTRIFEVFQRLHGRDAYPGTGIGLAIVRRIAEYHGGGIEARAAPGAGAVFVLRLPVLAARDPGQLPRRAAQA